MAGLSHKGLQPSLILVLTGLLLVLALVFSLILGAVAIPLVDFPGLLAMGPFPDSSLGTAGSGQDLSQFYYIFWHIRMPRVVGALLSGAALALAGALMQGLFQNPLAGPDVLGVSSGASLGAVLAVVTLGGAGLLFALPLAAVVGALVVSVLIYSIATARHRTSLLYVILTGMAISGFVNGIISTVLLFSNHYQINLFIFWTMGGLEGRMWNHVLYPLPVIVVVGALVLWRSRRLDILALGEEQAHGAGIGVEKEKKIILVAAAVLTGMAIAIAGPIGFIGLLVPHLGRLIIGPLHRYLLPFSALAGGLVMVSADLLGRMIAPPFEIRVGIITALLGSPLFLALVLRHRRGGLS